MQKLDGIGISATKKMLELNPFAKKNGMGIATKDQYRIFEKFHTGCCSSLFRESGRTGLGLAIAKGILKPMRAAYGRVARSTKEAHSFSHCPKIMIKYILSKLKIGPVVVPTTEPLNNKMRDDLKKGSSYLVKEPKAEFSFDLFVSQVKGRCSGCDYLDSFPCESIGCERCELPCTCKRCKRFRAQGLCFTMLSPQEIRLRYALQTTPIFWISNHGPNSINPIDLEGIADIIIKFLKQSKNPVVLLDGIEHLIFENGSAPVLRLLRDIEEWIILEKAILILPANPAAIEKKELALIERNMNELRPKIE